MADPLDDFEHSSFTAEGTTRAIHRIGTGPAVIVISEIPGITPNVARFARMVAGIGCTAVMPHLFGVDGKDPSVPYALRSMVQTCVSKEFTALALDRTSPVTTWLRALARSEHERCGGPGVGAVGMCLTGGFALAMMVDDVMLAPVLSQPSLPFPMGRARRRALGISDADAERVRERVAAGVCVLGLRFTGDRVSPHERFAALSELLGDGFVGVELDSSPGNPYGHRKGAHSVLTEDLDDRPGTPTREALDQVLDLFRTRLVA
ncbi:MAG: dienelactone hydrolase family protein [Acidimicrobiales bacterium]|jgi:dienelactone hydrolase